MEQQNHLKWMNLAIEQAQIAYKKNEVPVGAVIVKHNQLISKAYNLREKLQTPLGHAEILAIHRAAKKLNSWRLNDCTLYITLEPCLMCCGSILQARISHVIFSASDPKGGAACSLYQTFDDARLNHQVDFQKGLLEDKSGNLLKKFFKELREKKK